MKKYKLFGIINIIDLLVLVVIILAAAFLGTKFLGGSDTEGAPEINITFTTKEVSDFVKKRKMLFKKETYSQIGIYCDADSRYKMSNIFNPNSSTDALEKAKYHLP